MPAHEALHNYQFEMFMPAHKLFNELEAEDSYDGKTLGDDSSLADERLDMSQEGGAHDARSTPRTSEDENWDHSNIKGSDTLYKSIQKQGVVTPVYIAGRDADIFNPRLSIIDGHHRVAAAYDINPDMEVPVRYTWDKD